MNIETAHRLAANLTNASRHRDDIIVMTDLPGIEAALHDARGGRVDLIDRVRRMANALGMTRNFHESAMGVSTVVY